MQNVVQATTDEPTAHSAQGPGGTGAAGSGVAGGGGQAGSAVAVGGGDRRTRPIQVAGHYPVRTITFYQFSASDIRSIGVAQAATTICASIGTFALSWYIDFSKDIALAVSAKQPVDDLLRSVVEVSFWSWVVFWAVALAAFLWQGNELGRIKEEHGETTWVRGFLNWLRRSQ